MLDPALVALGFDDERLQECRAKGYQGLCGRVVRVDRGAASVLTQAGQTRVETRAEDPFVVGDWIALEEPGPVRLDRRTELVRRSGPHNDERQPVAANVDLVLVMSSLVSQFRLNLLSTFLVMTYDAGVTPLVVLTKADLSSDPEDVCIDVAARLGGVETFAISTLSGHGVEELRQRIVGHSVVLLGESGVGKSTLINVLCDTDDLVTAEVSRGGQGRHTTTHRELVLVPTGGVVIDTPGVRDAVSFDSGRGLERTFHDVVDLAQHCRFPDCSHKSTPGCAIDRALVDGEISQERVDAYFYEIDQQDALLRASDRRDSPGPRTPRKKRSRNQRDELLDD